MTMALDATYDHLLRLLANRGLGWLRDRTQSLPARLSPADPALAPLAMAARLAPVLSGLRGTPSPLEEIVLQRLDASLARRVAALVWRDESDADRLAPLLAGGRIAGGEQPLWQLARQRLAADPPRDLAERLDLADPPDPALLAEIEEMLSRPVPNSELTDIHIDLFYRILTRLYCFGARRPRFISARIFGKAFGNCLHFSEWARINKSLTAIAQMVTCLRLIDPDHDVSELLAEVIPCQRPDGSFPARSGWSDQPQGFEAGAAPTLAVIAALHLVTWRRWRMAVPAPASTQPMHACRDQIATRVMDRLAEARAFAASDRLVAAASISRATGRNGFALLGLQGHAPGRADMRLLALRLAGFPDAIRHARRTLSLGTPLQDLLSLDPRPEDCPRLPAALRWLQRSQGPQTGELPDDLLRQWDRAAARGDQAGFLRHCELALQHRPAQPTARIRTMATHLAQRELRAFDARPRARLPELLHRLDRLSLLAPLFEPEARLAAAA